MEKEKEQEEKKEKKTLCQRKKKIVDWAKVHKKELAITSVSITAAGIAVVFGINNRNALEEVFVPVRKSFRKKPETISKMPETIPAIPKPIPEVKTGSSGEAVSEKVIDVVVPVKKRVPHDVRMHLRTLPVNQKPSSDKINQAKALEIDLGPNQTWVSPYRTRDATV